METDVFTDEVLRSATALMQQHGEDAYLVASDHYETLLEDGSHSELEIWTQVLWAIESFCSDKPMGTVH